MDRQTGQVCRCVAFTGGCAPPEPEAGDAFLRVPGRFFGKTGFWDSVCAILTAETEQNEQEGTDMAFQIGFTAEHAETAPAQAASAAPQQTAVPRRSVVQVQFAGQGRALAYYNDRFDLRCGDLVYVDGKLEGRLGRVTAVEYSFRIRLSDYRRVIARVDTEVHGQFFQAGSHLVTFDPAVLPSGKAVRWFKAPEGEDEVFVRGSDADEGGFPLEYPRELGASAAVWERGEAYYAENRVRYLCLNGTCGYAVVEGTQAYEVEFRFRDGRISGMLCGCPCCGACKHEAAVLLQLRETLEAIRAHWEAEYTRTGYFAAVDKGSFFRFAVDGRAGGSLTLA